MAGKEQRGRAGAASTAAREPGLLSRVLADQLYTFGVIGVVVALLSAWAIYQKVSGAYEVPAPLYLYLGLGLGLLAALVGARYLSDEVQRAIHRNRVLRESKVLLGETERVMGEGGPGGQLAEAAQGEIREAAERLAARRDASDWSAASEALTELDRALDRHLGGARKSTTREYLEAIGTAFLIALVLRAFVVEAFKIPSGSMIPTLQVGDHIFVNKFIYGLRVPFTNIKIGMQLRKPQRGEVAVFKYPRNPEQDFIKRIVAVEGDTIEVRDNVLYINGEATPKVPLRDQPCEYEDFDERDGRWVHRTCDAYQETLNGHVYTTIYDRGSQTRNFAPTRIGPNQVFAMGDNRDNSHDSRYWGTVPFELLKGKAMVIWWSQGEPEGIRVKRMGQRIP